MIQRPLTHSPKQIRIRTKPDKPSFEAKEKTITGLDVTKIQRTIDDLSSGFVKLNSGATKMRILPPQACQEGDIGLIQTIHFGFQDSKGGGRTVACLRGCSDEECPVCRFTEQLQSTGEEEDKKLSSDMRATTQILCEVIVRPGKQIKLFRMPVSVYKKLVSAASQPEIGDFTDPDTGRDVLVTKTGSGMQTRYDAQLLDRSPLNIKNWRSKRKNLQAMQSPVLPTKRLLKKLRLAYGYEG